MKHLLRRVSAAALCALMLTGTAQAAVITPSAARVELAEDETLHARLIRNLLEQM